MGFSYDAGDELTQTSNGAGATATPSATFQYDKLGERTKLTPIPYQFTTNPGLPITYAYDQAGRLTSVTPTTGTATSYSYNGDGLRTTKAGTTNNGFVWDQTGQYPLILADGQNSYIYGNYSGRGSRLS
jgi:YD repeat-containing protein